MAERAQSQPGADRNGERGSGARSAGPAAQRPSRRPAPQPAQAGALALQRAIGNRATARLLSRWAAHPDKDKKGVLMPDATAAEYSRFNPPLSK